MNLERKLWVTGVGLCAALMELGYFSPKHFLGFLFFSNMEFSERCVIGLLNDMGYFLGPKTFWHSSRFWMPIYE